MFDVFEVARERKSVRTYDGKPLNEADRLRLAKIMDEADNPFDIKVTFRLLDAEEHGLKSPVINGEHEYVAAKINRCQLAELAYGYSFEKFVLSAWAYGIGSVWIGGTMNRDAFEETMELSADEFMPCVTPVGYAAPKRALRETMMRAGVKADKRKPIGELFFDGDFSTPMTDGSMQEAGIKDVLEAVRWAPSAVNKQPWRIVKKDGAYHFYEKHDKGFVWPHTGDLQKIDIGIALCHFVLGIEQMGMKADVSVDAPKIDAPDGTEYVVTIRPQAD